MAINVAKLGLKENWQQFTLLLIVNAFVGGMVGLERTILPKLAEEEFYIVDEQYRPAGFNIKEVSAHTGIDINQISRFSKTKTIGFLVRLILFIHRRQGPYRQTILVLEVVRDTIPPSQRHTVPR